MMEARGTAVLHLGDHPYNGHWPQVTIIWELDAFADYARIGRAQAPGGSHRDSAAAWSEYLAAAGASGEGRIMYAGRSNRTLAQLLEAKFGAGLVIQEIMQTKPGNGTTTSASWSGCTCPGRSGPGSAGSARSSPPSGFNEVIHYWALDGEWDCFENHYPSWKDSPPAGSSPG